MFLFFSPFNIAITSLGEERANLSAFRTFVRFVFVWFCGFPLPTGVWEGLRFLIVALLGRFSYLFFENNVICYKIQQTCLGTLRMTVFYTFYFVARYPCTQPLSLNVSKLAFGLVRPAKVQVISIYHWCEV